MKELIEELEYNQKINIEKNLENRVNIDYVIERLKDISNKKSKIRYQAWLKLNDNDMLAIGPVRGFKTIEEVYNAIQNNVNYDSKKIQGIIIERHEISKYEEINF